MRICWHSNSPLAPTGYGRQTAIFTPMLAEEHEIAISANYGLEAAPILWHDIPVLPGLGGDHGNGTIPGHISAIWNDPRDGLLFTLYDTVVWGPIFKRYNTACWTPIDHDPLPPAVTAFFRESGAIPIAMSRFGQEQLAEFEPLYCPHGVSEVYKPEPSDVREQMGIGDDDWLMSIIAANKGRPSRKCFTEQFIAASQIMQRHENAYLYVHTTIGPDFGHGEDLMALATSLQIPEDRFKMPNQYSMMFAPIPDATMAKIYTASDVLLNCSMGEGFGIPILEAAACGTPAIVTDFSSMPEVAGPAGWKVGGRPYWSAQASWMCVPDIERIVEALEECYGLSDAEYQARSEMAREHAGDYRAEKVYREHMAPALEEVQERIGARKPELIAA